MEDASARTTNVPHRYAVMLAASGRMPPLLQFIPSPLFFGRSGLQQELAPAMALLTNNAV